MVQLYCIYITDKCNSCIINVFKSAVCNQHMMHEQNKAFQIMGGICPGGICPGGKCPGGKCPGGYMSGGKCPWGTCLRGFCPVTDQPANFPLLFFGTLPNTL